MKGFLILTLALVAMVSVTESLKVSGWKGVGGRLIRVSVGPAGVWGVNKAHNIYVRVGRGWKRIPGKLKEIESGRRWVWGVNKSNNIFRRHGIRGKWQHIRGKLAQVSACEIYNFNF